MNEAKRQLIENSFRNSEMLKFYQAELLEVEKGYISMKIPKLSFATRKAGMFNGAVISSLVDVSSGFAAVSNYEEDAYVVTVELKVNFLQPALGDYLVSKSYVVRGGSKVSVIRTEIYTQSENTEELHHVATSLVTMMKVR